MVSPAKFPLVTQVDKWKQGALYDPKPKQLFVKEVQRSLFCSTTVWIRMLFLPAVMIAPFATLIMTDLKSESLYVHLENVLLQS